MCKEHGVDGYAAVIRQTRRVPRNESPKTEIKTKTSQLETLKTGLGAANLHSHGPTRGCKPPLSAQTPRTCPRARPRAGSPLSRPALLSLPNSLAQPPKAANFSVDLIIGQLT